MKKQQPELPWTKSPIIYTLYGGIPPFTSLLYFLEGIYIDLWEDFEKIDDEFYCTLLTALTLFVLFTMLTSSFLNMHMLNNQVSNWWWWSFSFGAMSGLYIYIYSQKFFSDSPMSGMAQVSFFWLKKSLSVTCVSH